jgi:hypothetical protein
MGRLQDQLLDHVGRVLSPRDTPGGSLSHGRWPAVWSMVKGLFRRGAAEPEGGRGQRAGSGWRASSCGGHVTTRAPGTQRWLTCSGPPGVAGAESEEELQMMLSRLHSMIYLQVGPRWYEGGAGGS